MGSSRVLQNTYAELLRARWILPAGLLAAGIGWIIYAIRLRPDDRIVGRLRTLSVTNGYVSIATTVMMFVIAAFTCRTFVVMWYLGRVTSDGFTFDSLEWSVATETIGRLLVGVNWFYIVLSLVLLVFVVHDRFLYKRKRALNPLRILGTLVFVVVIALTAVLGPLWIVHDNLLAAKIVVVEELIVARREAPNESGRAAVATTIEEVRSLPEWPLTFREGALPIVGQLVVLGVAAAMRHGGGSYLRDLLVRNAGKPLITGPNDL